MKIDVLVAEIGSTTTIVNAFHGIHTPQPRFLGQGQAPTSVRDGDVTIGLKAAIHALEATLGVPEISYEEMFASSSAAGGLRMSVHGLAYEMTVKAAKEAALSAGAIIKYITAGKLRRAEISKIIEVDPGIILVVGGVDYGERETALHNFEILAKNCPDKPIIYAGNIQNQDEIRLIAKEYGTQVYIVDNVYPKIDLFDLEPARRIIHNAFEEYIVNAPGMTSILDMVNGAIIPTPGSVMIAAKLLYEEIGDLIVFDVGGATTDLHSVTEGSDEISRISMSEEPVAKRTVEGDLGVYVNVNHIVEKIGLENIKKHFPNAEQLISQSKPIPQTQEERSFIEYLTKEAVFTALERHAGKVNYIYGPSGKRAVAQGKDLTAVKYIIGTGGPLVRLSGGEKILQSILEEECGSVLYPQKGAKVLIDKEYIMSSVGVLSTRYREAAMYLMKKSLGIGGL